MDFRFKRLSIRALNIGVSVKLTSSETRIANDIVRAMDLKNRPGMLCINATGRKITTSDRVVAITAMPISLVASIAAACGLIAYGAVFQRKTRHLVAVLVVLAVPRAAFACPVCFGQSDSPMASAANLSILFMLIVTVAMLTAFAAFFIHLMRRARAAEGPDYSPPDGGHYGRTVDGGTQEGTVQC